MKKLSDKKVIKLAVSMLKADKSNKCGAYAEQMASEYKAACEDGDEIKTAAEWRDAGYSAFYDTYEQMNDEAYIEHYTEQIKMDKFFKILQDQQSGNITAGEMRKQVKQNEEK